jgi:hypothetical protein
MMFYVVKTGTKIRLEIPSKDEAVSFAQRLYKSEGVIADITVIEKLERKTK